MRRDIISKKQFLLLTIIPLTIIILWECIVYKNPNETLNNFIIGSAFSYFTEIDIKKYVQIVDNLYYIVLFSFLYGTYIYNRFRKNAPYLFTRVRNRKKWFTEQYIEISIFALIFTLFFLCTITVIGCITTGDKPDITTFALLGRMTVIIALLLVAVTILINIISCKLNSVQSFIFVFLAILCLVYISTVQELDITDNNNLSLKELWNPINGLILNSIQKESIQYCCIIQLFIICVILYFIGRIMTKNMDITLIDNEAK